jgi:flagellar P-ring protein precursor FlgI
MRRIAMLLLLVLGLPLASHASGGVRIKDITDLDGARKNYIYGLGLVVGLNNTGSKSSFTAQFAIDLVQKLKGNGKLFAELPSDPIFKPGNVAVVKVMAELGPFARRGSQIDVMVAAYDDSKSLFGGMLVFTPLYGPDAEVYAVAQGPISVGGFLAGGRAASAQQNHPNVGRIPGGGIVEAEARGEILCRGSIRFLLKKPDYYTASAISNAVNKIVPHAAFILDPGTVEILVPRERVVDVVAFAGELGLLEVVPDSEARVVINERTGTIVAGENVKIGTIAIAHGNLTIVTSEEPQVSQPAPFSKGVTTVVPRTNVAVSEQGASFNLLPRSTTVGDLAKAMNALGVTPRDLIAIFQAIKQTGALHAELVIQ